MSASKHQHYFKNVKHLDLIDVYRVLDLFSVTDPALAHAAKKILCAGIRGAKDQAKDVQEAIDTLLRWQEMQAENGLVPRRNEKGSESDKTITFSNPSYQEWVDKELASSGIYGDAGYTEQEMQAASLVHDAELNPDLVALCANTTIHADEDGWIRHIGKHSPLSKNTAIQLKGINSRAGFGGEWVQLDVQLSDYMAWSIPDYITHWRYAK